jgi:uncharacterized OB-fold protein
MDTSSKQEAVSSARQGTIFAWTVIRMDAKPVSRLTMSTKIANAQAARSISMSAMNVPFKNALAASQNTF